ncbi:snf2 superfamily protein [Moniliophthora roreri MCA 2997]|uniref:Snf2 superfamily protein n=1 Tax=Moniliophthora roreri (strain MCA 2997) TaxID=1381753 RepID=V2X949_MONRO|nr:snf2 superfamily protein [Moniliophthora roreri MCA 2997]
MSSDHHIALAKTHLGLPNSATVPQAYLDQLKTHLSIYPYDTNFRVTAQPNIGYGKVHCYEDGCRDQPHGTIQLERNSVLSDGGLKDGIGSLAAYRKHVVDHPTHLRQRNERIKATLPSANNATSSSTQMTPTNTAGVKKERSSGSLLDALDAKSPFGSQGQVKRTNSLTRTSTPAPSSSDISRLPALAARQRLSLTPSSSPKVKTEATESTIPSKRRISDIAIGSDSASSSLKKLKKEPSLKGPLEAIDSNAPVASSSKMDTEEVRQKIQRVQSELSHKQSLLDNLLRKKRKTGADYTRAIRYNEEIAALGRQKTHLKGSLPAVMTSPTKVPQLPMPSTFPAPPHLRQELVTPTLTAPSHLPTNPLSAPTYFPAAIKQEPDIKPSITSRTSNIPVAGPSTAPTHASNPAPARMDPDALANAVVQQYQEALPVIQAMNDPYDENGDFFGRGRDMFQGPTARQDDIEKFLLEAGNAELFDGSATVETALEKLGLPSIFTPIPGMEVALMPHQAIGVAWMVEKEQSKLNGGCLADEMGLGKTVQMIATMVKNRSNNPNCKTNLILAPLALLDQWKLEIELKTNDLFKCLIYHGSSKPKRKSDLLKYDIVITTFHTMSNEWPDAEAELRKQKKARKSKGNDFIVDDSDDEGAISSKKKSKECGFAGLLFNVDFYRIILDEAQNIRNKRNRMSRAVTHLQAKYRWCLTGTPIINSLVDTYSLIRFLQIRPFYDWDEFNSHVGRLEKKRPDLGVMRLQKILDTFLLRRKKDTMLDGKRLIGLPDRSVKLSKLVFSDEEREIYEMVERKSQATFNRFLRAGTVLKNYHQVLVLLLRLRQVCNHPCLIQEQGDAFVLLDEFDNESRPAEVRRELARARDLVSPQFVVQLKERFKHEALKRIEAEKESEDAALEDEDCPICYDVFTDAVVTAPCAHVFCRECIFNVLNTPANEHPDEPNKYKPDERPCPSCRSAICADRLFTRAAFEPTDAELNPVAPEDEDVEMVDISAEETKVEGKKGKGKAASTKTKSYGVIDIEEIVGTEDEEEFDQVPRRPSRKRGKGKGKRKAIVLDSDEEAAMDEDEDNDLSDFIVQSDEDEEEKDARRALKKRLGKRKAKEVIVIDSSDEEDEVEVIHGRKKLPTSPEAIKNMPRFLPSTKMKAMMEEITRLTKEKPEEKTLIISQWTACLSLVSDYLTEYGILHVKYQGDMNRVKRDQAVRVFMSKDKASIMLMSMKCGGVGLNLTRANNVISLDLGWSQAVENQAFDRVHRLGQTRAVNIQRFVIENTVEDRILALQDRKQQLADGSLGEGNSKKVGKLTVKQLANLFGLDARGRVIAD